MAQPHPLLSRREPIHDVHPDRINIEVFYADRTLETFGRGGAGWFWWSRRRGCSPDGSPTGPFATSYSAYRHAISSMPSTLGDARTLGEQSVAFHVPTM
jgi:hypothetical protein